MEKLIWPLVILKSRILGLISKRAAYFVLDDAALLPGESDR